MHFRIGTNICKCLGWLLNTEPGVCSLWKDELHAALELSSLLLSFTVLNMEFCEIKKND